MLLRTISPRIFFHRTPAKTFLKSNTIRTMSTPSTMKAVYVNEQGGVDNLIYNDVPVPKVDENSVLVKNRFVGVNFIDTYQRGGVYPVSLPFTLGREG